MSRKKGIHRFEAHVTVMPRRAVLDPQGKAIEQALLRLGYRGVEDLRAGKVFRLTLLADDEGDAHSQASGMAERLLANPIMEDWSVEVFKAAPPADETAS